MKNLKLLVLSSVLISGLSWGADSVGWQVQSTEKQFEKTSELIYKSSEGIQNNLLPTAQSKTTTSVNIQKDTMAKTLTVRPYAKAINGEFWIYDAWVEFYRDNDRDGYFNHFSVEFDADTEYSSAQVYARLYLGKNEIFKEYHTTSNFDIFSDNSDDSFVVESELLKGFSSAEYEVLIELYDAYTDELVAVLDGNDDADLYLLSLESKDYEYTQVVIVNEHGGSLGWLSLLLLPLLLVYRLGRKI